MAALAVLALLTGLLAATDAWLRHRRAGNLALVTAAYQRNDCATALEAWRQATQDPALPGRRQPPTEEVTRAVNDCRALQAADRLATQGDTERAFAAYLRLDSPLARDVVSPRLTALLETVRTPSRALCQDLRGAVTDRVLTRDDAVPAVLAACGELLEATDHKAAFALVSAVRRDYPKAPAAREAATVEARLRLASARRAPHKATTPFHAATAPGGDARVRFVNHAPWPVTLTLSGPDGGRVVSLPACRSCGPYVTDISWRTCLGKGAAATVTVPAGRYEVALQYAADGPEPSHGFWDLRPGTYEECYFFTR